MIALWRISSFIIEKACMGVVLMESKGKLADAGRFNLQTAHPSSKLRGIQL
jgi:hypothetical protein